MGSSFLEYIIWLLFKMHLCFQIHMPEGIKEVGKFDVVNFAPNAEINRF